MNTGRLLNLARTPGLAALALALLMPLPQAIAAEGEAQVKRPRIGLVLGGGGARGAAHVGVLKVLEELRIPIDVVAGTSMGSIVGGLYASGMSPQDIEREMRAMDWEELFKDAPPRADRSYRRKGDDKNYAFKAKLGVTEGKPNLPLGFVHGQKFDLAIARLTEPVVNVRNFNSLPIPYRAVASDLETGKEVVLDHGSLALAIRASMAVPAAFDPVEIDGRLLVDGGITNNVPVSVARAMGADVLIVVDVGSGLFTRDQIRTALDVTAQLANMLFTLNTETQLKTLGSQDVLMRPPLGDIGGGDFKRTGEAIPLGEQSARESLTSLARYSLSAPAYAAHLAARAQRMPKAPTVQFVRVDNQSGVGKDVIRSRISAKAGEPLDVKQLEADIGRVYGLDIFESVRYDIVEEDGKTGLVVTAKEKSWGPGYLQAGLATSSNFKGDSSFRFGLLYSRTALNTLNGEFRLAAQVGDTPLLAAEIYQPLDPASKYFVHGLMRAQRRNYNVYDAKGRNLAKYRLDSFGIDLAAGREFDTWGEARIGYRREAGSADVIIGNPTRDVPVDRGEVYMRLGTDKIDNLSFPRTGHGGRIEYRYARESLGASHNYEQADFTLNRAYSWGEHTLIGSSFLAATSGGNAPLGARYNLGGFLRLSGTQEDEFSGSYAGLLSLIYMRRLYRIPFVDTYIGGAVQVGNAWQRSQDISLNNSIWSGTLFLGFDTPVGPLYFGYGQTDRHDSSFHLYLGPRFTF